MSDKDDSLPIEDDGDEETPEEPDEEFGTNFLTGEPLWGWG